MLTKKYFYFWKSKNTLICYAILNKEREQCYMYQKNIDSFLMGGACKTAGLLFVIKFGYSFIACSIENLFIIFLFLSELYKYIRVNAAKLVYKKH